MKILYFLVLAWVWNYMDYYNSDFKDTFIMGIAIMIYSVVVLLKEGDILNRVKHNLIGFAMNLFVAIIILPGITCIGLYKFNFLMYKNTERVMSGSSNFIMSGLLLLVLMLIPILIIYFPNKIMQWLSNNEIANSEMYKSAKLNKSFEKLFKKFHIEINKILGDEVIEKNVYLDRINEEKGYKFNNTLSVIEYKSKCIYLNNDDKYSYYNSIRNDIKKINKQEFTKNVKKKTLEINHLVNKIKNSKLQESKELKRYLNQIDNKIKCFEYYLNKRLKYIYNDYEGVKSGIEGEEAVNKELEQYGNIINLTNIRLEIPDNKGVLQSIENDNILLTTNGIFLIEVKNFGDVGNYDIIIEKDGRWLKRFRDSNEIGALKNVTKQNNRHIAYFDRFINNALNKGLDDYIESKGMVVIANEKATIYNNNDNLNVFRDSEIYSYVKSHDKQLTSNEIDIIKNLLLSNNLPLKKYPVYKFIDEVYGNIRAFNEFYNKTIEILSKLENLCDEYYEENKKIERTFY